MNMKPADQIPEDKPEDIERLIWKTNIQNLPEEARGRTFNSLKELRDMITEGGFYKDSASDSLDSTTPAKSTPGTIG